MLVFATTLIGLSLTPLPTSSRAQHDLIAVCSDATHTNCAVTDSCYNGDCNYLVFWVFHFSTTGAKSSRFKAPAPPTCFIAEIDWLGDSRPFPGTIGDSQVGITIPYGFCRTGWTHILTIWYFTPYSGPDCCEYAVFAHPQASTGQVEVLDCADNWISAHAASAVVNPGPSCPCSSPTGIAFGVTTWGAVKALYVDD
jgi:hypothetical protein